MALLKCPDCLADVSDAAPACPKCGRTLAAGKAVLVRRVAFTGPGAWIQGLGVVPPFIGFAKWGALGIIGGLMIGAAFVVLGRWMNRYSECGRCGLVVPDDATVCHACRSTFLR